MNFKSFKKILLGAAATMLSGTMVLSAVLPELRTADGTSVSQGDTETASITRIPNPEFDLSRYFDTSVVQRLPDAVDPDQRISVLVYTAEETVLDAYSESGAESDSLADFASSSEGKSVVSRIEKQNRLLQNKLKNAGIPFELGYTYDTLMGGFEAIIRADQFEKFCNAVDGEAGVMVGEEYAACETQVVENEVNVYPTGIFDSSDSPYSGSGTVIAVLDTGLDYTHPAFDPDNFEGEEVIDSDYINERLNRLAAKTTSPDLTAAEVYLNPKVPFAYDYADGDAEVCPINNVHGTHVAGIMVGQDDEIRGVAPNAQLAVMKVFSESTNGARQSWLIAALEDCVTLGVDVINMSLGSSAGFSREVDGSAREVIYSKVKESGISLVAAASNDYNSTFGSEKNGNLGLTSNPDTATVGSPSTYDAALSVASISGVKTPYLLFNGTIIYYTEASDRASEPLDFVELLLKDKPNSREVFEYEYVVIPGVGREADYASYPGSDALAGKIALVKRGQTNFEEKARIAKNHGAAGCIIYNNVSGDISMTIGEVRDFAVCSVSLDDGMMLISAPAEQRKISVSREQEAGPFMSNFSSWGPTPDLGIKPEITAHGGDIYSAVPGNSYDRLSGTSMACPNQAGVTALVRQYVKDTFSLTGNDNATRQRITAIVNQLMMSTADIAYNTNGLPFSVRKQGAGLANLAKATSSKAYLEGYDREDPEQVIDKAKIEVGDDPQKTGLYSLKFNIVNLTGDRLSYDVDAIVMTEGVSATLTARGDRTVTEKGYILGGAEVLVASVQNGSSDGNKVYVDGKQTAVVTVTISLSGQDKDYLDANFANGMYVEGYVTLSHDGETIDLNIPYLAFYGDWTQAPLFDIDYFETNRDELDDSKDIDEKVLPDAYATRPIGGTYQDYIAYLGAYMFQQDPSSTNKISADRDRIALTNQEGENGGVNNINSINLGLLRGAKRVVTTITDTTTGEVIWERTEWNQYKAHNGGAAIYPSALDVEFYVREHDLKNNTKYILKVTGYLDYGEDGGLSTNLKNTFEIPFYTDFTAPVVTGVTYTFEYDSDAKKNRLFANVDIFDNHYVEGIMPGYVFEENGSYGLQPFQQYIIPVMGARNSTSTVQIELTDYLDDLKKSHNGNSFIIQAYDYAQNISTFELTIPDDIKAIEFPEMVADENGEGGDGVTISVNQTYELKPNILPTQDTVWRESLNYSVQRGGEGIIRIVNGKVIGVSAGTATVIAESNHPGSKTQPAYLTVHVLGENDEGYEYFDPPVAESFRLTGYTVNKVFYRMSTDERDLKATAEGQQILFAGNSRTLKMFPSESVTLLYELENYFEPGMYKVEFSSGNPSVADVDENGRITALNVRLDADGNIIEHYNSERNTTVTVSVLMWDPAYENEDGSLGAYRPTVYSQTVAVTVKEAYTTNGPYLATYSGLGGTVVVPDSFGSTEISQYAFSNYRYIPKDLDAGDVISEEDPLATKPTFIGDDTIKEVILPEGIEVIGPYAFANLTALTKITLPTTLTKIQVGAFYGCSALQTIEFRNGVNHLQFINEYAFYGCGNLMRFPLDSIIAVGNYAFASEEGAGGNYLTSITFPETAQSIGAYAFANNSHLTRFEIKAASVKVGAGAFQNCSGLTSMKINASVIPAGLFDGCTKLASLEIGPAVEVIGQDALRGTAIGRLTASGNPNFISDQNGQALLDATGKRVVLVVPEAVTYQNNTVTEIGTGAFSSATGLRSATLKSVTSVGDYAFSGCESLANVSLGKLTGIGTEAFALTAITRLPELSEDITIGDYAFFGTALTAVTLPDGTQAGAYSFGSINTLRSVDLGDGVTAGEGAFYGDRALSSVTIGNDAVIGMGAFSALSGIAARLPETIQGMVFQVYDITYNSSISELSIGENAVIADSAFRGAGLGIDGEEGTGGLSVIEIGDGAVIGDGAFMGAATVTEIDLSRAKSVGAYAFSTLPSYRYYVNEAQGEILYTTLLYRAPGLTHVDLTSAADSADEAGNPVPAVGEGAFANSRLLESVVLGAGIEAIGDAAFAYCELLSDIDLRNITVIGSDAFNDCIALASAEVAAGAEVGANAFAGCTALTSVNLGEISVIGDSAFAGTALTEADLTAAVEVGSFAFRSSAVTDVTFGDLLEKIGENPFADCKELVFERGGTDTFEVGTDGIKVIGGVLYRTAPNGGLELICYPLGKTGITYTVEDGTVRIGAEAFRSTGLAVVTLAREIKAIGDKAFYGCNSLGVVVFRSLEVPILEEQYDTSVEESSSGVYLRMIGTTRGGAGLGIVTFDQWNADATTVLYGANFVAEIGTEEGIEAHDAKTLVMVRPMNGNGYENWLYFRYFDAALEGALEMEDRTVEIANRIRALPAPVDVTLEWEGEVTELRALYNALTEDQKYLLNDEIGILEAAESAIEFLKRGSDTPAEEQPGETDDEFPVLAVALGISIPAGVLLIAGAVVLILVLKKKHGEPEAEEDGAEETEAAENDAGATSEENAEDTTEETPEEDER